MYFEEEQEIDVWWLKLLMLVVVAVSLGSVYYGLIKQLSGGVPWGDNPMSDKGMIIFAIVMTLIMSGVLLLVFGTKLKTMIRDDGIHLAYFPFFKNRFLARERIESFEIRKYKPFREYGGYGLRNSLRNGRAYNMGGNIGLQLYLVDGKRVLIGTQRSDAINRAMEKLISEQ